MPWRKLTEATLDLDEDNSKIAGIFRSMQLDLFSDNRRTILLNDAGTMLRSLDLKKALSVYAGLLDDSPGDRE